MIRKLAVLLLVSSLAACATTTRTETRRNYTATNAVQVGDEVLIKTKDGRKLQFRVTQADNKVISGKGLAVERAEIASLKVAAGTTTVTTQESSAAPAAQAIGTVAIVGGIVAVVAILAVF